MSLWVFIIMFYSSFFFPYIFVLFAFLSKIIWYIKYMMREHFILSNYISSNDHIFISLKVPQKYLLYKKVSLTWRFIVIIVSKKDNTRINISFKEYCKTFIKIESIFRLWIYEILKKFSILSILVMLHSWFVLQNVLSQAWVRE